MTLSEAVARMREALAMKPTRGPWEVLDGTRVSVVLQSLTPDCGYDSHCAAITHYGRLDAAANATLIAACDPDSIRLILDALEAAQDHQAASLRQSPCVWVPVSERLPAEDEEVLLWWSAEFPCDVGSFFGRGWQSANGSMREYDASPTHWMPLPPPPAAEQRQAARPDEQEDAARLDWIEKMILEHAAVWLMPCGEELRFVQLRWVGNSDEVENFPTVSGLRAAIDAAMTKEQTP